MADDQGTTTETPPTAPPTVAAVVPPTVVPPTAPPAAPPAATLDLASVMDAVNSIPERVADAIREATPPPRTRTATSKTAKTAGTTAPVETTITPVRKGFADWWFGK